jgi:hypothetical protein
MEKERQSKEVSLALWTIEKTCFEYSGFRKCMPDELMNIIDAKINDYSLTYEEFLEDLGEALKETTEETANDKDKFFEPVLSFLLNKYKGNGEEV